MSSVETISTLQTATTYDLTLSNSTQDNGAATGDLNIVATHHAVTITGGGSVGPSATTIGAGGLNAGTSRDRVFHITRGNKIIKNFLPCRRCAALYSRISSQMRRISMSGVFKSLILLLFISPFCFSQDPMPVLRAGWQRTVQKAPRPEITAGGPVNEITADSKYFQRKAREARTDITIDPTETTVTARSQAMDRAVQESRVPQADDIRGYSYVAEVRNDSGKTAEIFFWEYRFAEIAHPANVVRRQFLCGGKLKSGEKRSLSVFSLLGPSDTITLESLSKSSGKLFTEEVYINRIEFSDGSILQRDDWKYGDVKEGVKRATSTPWGKETCRSL